MDTTGKTDTRTDCTNLVQLQATRSPYISRSQVDSSVSPFQSPDTLAASLTPSPQDQLDDLLHTCTMLDTSENRWTTVTHLGSISLHNIKRGANIFGNVDLRVPVKLKGCESRVNRGQPMNT